MFESLPDAMTQITVRSSLDGSMEKNLLYLPDHPCGESVPLLVGLHSWSRDRSNHIAMMLPHAQERGWALLLPEFRGPNLDTNPRALETAGSTLAKQDVVDAIEYVGEHHRIDRSKIFLVGGSGGGHMSLMMASYRPDLFAAISSWCPITDLAAWHAEGKYLPHIIAVCGGNPGDSMEVDARYRDKSPMSHLSKIARANLCVHHGRHDPTVPYTHTVKFAQALEALHPEHFYFEVFDGGHDLHGERAMQWFDRHLHANDEKASALTG